MRVVIVGNGVAGIWAANTLTSSPGVSINILTDEEYLYYNRPHLLEYIAGTIKFDDIFVYPEKWYIEKGIRMRLRESVLAIDPNRKEITTKDGKLGYDELLLATGSRPSILPIKGVEKKGVFTFRSARDAISIREYSQNARRAVVVGGGLLGLETAGALRSLGLEVTVVEFLKRLLPKQIDEKGARLLTSMIEKMDIKVVTGAETDVILGGERVERIVLNDGTGIEADLCVISAGIRPRTELAMGASIKVNRGIVVDEHMQTSASDIYACGDVAEENGRIEGIIPVAMDQSKVVAFNILGKPTIYQSRPHPFMLKVRGIKLASVGDVLSTGGGYEERKKVDAENGMYMKLVFKGEFLVGAILLGDTSKLRTLQGFIEQRRDVSKLKDSMLEGNFG